MSLIYSKASFRRSLSISALSSGFLSSQLSDSANMRDLTLSRLACRILGEFRQETLSSIRKDQFHAYLVVGSGDEVSASSTLSDVIYI